VDVIKPPFTVEKYISGIREAEKLGYDLLIIDSLSHAWAGTGGILEFVDAKSESAKGNKFAGWREATPKHNSLVDAMLQSSMHVIATMRSVGVTCHHRSSLFTVGKRLYGRTRSASARRAMAPSSPTRSSAFF